MQEVDRSRRVSELVKRELSTLIQRELNDNRISNVTVNAVKVAKDLKTADVFVSRLAPIAVTKSDKLESKAQGKSTTIKNSSETPEQEVIRLLDKASGYLRHMLSQTIELRITPELRFKYDNSIQRGVEMSALIDKLNKK